MRHLAGCMCAVAAITAFSMPAATGPYENGIVAFKQGDYEDALQLMRPLAEQGIPGAQFSASYMPKERAS